MIKYTLRAMAILFVLEYGLAFLYSKFPSGEKILARIILKLQIKTFYSAYQIIGLD